MSRHTYTNEEDKWLIENFSKLGIDACLIQFNNKFNVSITKSALIHRCYRTLNLNVDKSVARLHFSNSCHIKKQVIGYERYDKHHNQMFVKVRDIVGGRNNFIARCRYNYMKYYNLDELPHNSVIIHLDGNSLNDDIDNLYLTDNYVQKLLCVNHWINISNKDMKLTAIKYCELYEALRNGGKEK